MKLRNYIAIARPEHWVKNAFILPGIVLAEISAPTPLQDFLPRMLIALVASCIVASANYTINEWLDAEFDRFHPVKKNRPSVVGNLNGTVVYLQYIVLAALGLGLSWLASPWIFWVMLAFFIQGFLYNVRPFRTKDRIYLDVISESINNPIRLLIGWFIVTSAYFPPASVLIGYWMFGAFLMDIKRYAELRFIGDAETAALYRVSFKHYTPQRLLIMAIFYALCSGFFFAVFMIKHRIELMLSLPLVAALYTWYLAIGMKDNSPAKDPERIPRTELGFTAYLLIFTAITLVLLYVDIPVLEWFLGPATQFSLKGFFGG